MRKTTWRNNEWCTCMSVANSFVYAPFFAQPNAYVPTVYLLHARHFLHLSPHFSVQDKTHKAAPPRDARPCNSKRTNGLACSQSCCFSAPAVPANTIIPACVLLPVYYLLCIRPRLRPHPFSSKAAPALSIARTADFGFTKLPFELSWLTGKRTTRRCAEHGDKSDFGIVATQASY